MLARRSTLPSSTQGHGEGLSVTNDASVRSECGEDGWVPGGGEAPFSWWFLAGVVSASESCVGSILLCWVKSFVGWSIASIYYFETLCICWSSRMKPLSSSMLDNLVRKFLGDSTYSEYLSLSPELTVDVTLLSGSAVILGVVGGLSICRVQFEFILPLLMVNGVAVLG